MIVSMITAMAKQRVIGRNGSMPWHLPADLAHFKRCTMGCPVIMGRKTYDSIGRPLPGRKNIVLSRSQSLAIESCTVVNSLDEALILVEDDAEVFIIGGQQLYRQALPLSHRLYLTHIDAEFEGDTFFPEYSHSDWNQFSTESYLSDKSNPWPYQFEVLERVAASSE